MPVIAMIYLGFYVVPPILLIDSGRRSLKKNGNVPFQFGLPDLLVLPIALIPSMYVLLGIEWKGEWHVPAIFCTYQLCGMYYGFCRYFERGGGWVSAQGLLLGAFIGLGALLVWGFMVSAVFFGIVVIFS